MFIAYETFFKDRWVAREVVKETSRMIHLRNPSNDEVARIKRDANCIVGPFTTIEDAQAQADWLTKRYQAIEKGAASARNDAVLKARGRIK